MTRLKKEEEEKLIIDNLHLKKYLEDISGKMDKPEIYSILPTDLKGEEFPNVIYLTKGVVFVHVFRTRDMEEAEYHAIIPVLDEIKIEKREKILELMYEKAHLKADINNRDDLRNAIKGFINKFTIVDEKSSGKLGKASSGKVRVTSLEKKEI